jgi:hypothetical protein
VQVIRRPRPRRVATTTVRHPGGRPVTGWTPTATRGIEARMSDDHLSREIIDKVGTDNVDRSIGKLTWSLGDGVFEEYGSPFWQMGQAKQLIDIFTQAEVSAWTGLAVMKRESSFGNALNNPHLDERNLHNPFGVHFNENPSWPANAKKNLLLIEDPRASYENKVTPAASAVGYRLPTFVESATRCALTIKHKSLSGYNPRGVAYKDEIDDHLRQILRRTYSNKRLWEELQRVYAERR